MTQTETDVVVVGAGLVGSILAIFLRQQGYSVRVFEKRPDMRKHNLGGGRSINLIATSRGLHALEQVGLKDEVLALTSPVYGRMMHNEQGHQIYQSYSKDNTDCNYSVPRGELNQTLMTFAEQAGATLAFEQELVEADFASGTLTFTHETVQAQRIFATDGAGSAIRRVLAEQGHVTEHTDFLAYGYKELEIPAGENGDYRIDKDALHIWPRGDHMLMALPNLDGSFTVTLYLANEGPLSFASLSDKEKVEEYFSVYYPDAIPLMPSLYDDFFANPTGLLGTVWCDPWYFSDRVVLLGDAAHGIVPFFGQGMNAGFEDCTVLHDLFPQHNNFGALFEAYHAIQKPNGDAIARMALDNFVEMRDKVGDRYFLLQKEVEGILGRTFPQSYLSKYSMVTHSLIPYSIAEQAGVIQQEILDELCANLTLAENVDLYRAETLINDKLTPFLQSHNITLEPSHS